MYQIRSDPSIHERQPGMNFNRAPSKRQIVKSRKGRVTKPDLIADEKKPDEKKPDKEEQELKKPDEDYEEIELDQPYDERYVSFFRRGKS